MRGGRPRRGRGPAAVLGVLLAAGTLALGRPSDATPPVAVSVWLDRAGIEAAAAAFEAEERRWFGRALAGLLGTERCHGTLPEPPFACVDEGALLTRALPVLVCPAVRAGRTDRVEVFFETLGRRRLVRGSVSFVGTTTVIFRLIPQGAAWAISNVHQAVSPQPGAEGRETIASLACPGRLDLTGARLAGLDLGGEDLSDVNLFDADLRGTDLTGADLRGADLRGANLEAARGLTRAQVESAVTDRRTRLPVSVERP